MGYLVCDSCGGYYELQEGENPEDFDDKCQCGGKLRFTEKIDINTTSQQIICPNCKTENPEIATFCSECGKNLLEKTKQTKKQRKEKSSNGIMGLWNKQKFSTKIIAGAFLIVALAIVGLYLSSAWSPTYEDNLIKASESGASQSVLAASIENHTKVVQDYLAASNRADVSLVEYKYKTGEITVSERDTQVNTLNTKYQENLKDYDSIKAIQIAYINGLTTANELKRTTDSLYQHSTELKKVQKT